MTPTKVMVTGNAGSGKTTLALELGSALGLPVHGLDRIVWRPGWRKSPLREKNAALATLVRQPAWVIDGVSPAVEESADFVVFLDAPPRTCAWRCAKRNWRFLFRSRPGLPPECPELRMIARLLKVIWRFNRHVRPRIIDRMTTNPERYRHVSSAEDRARIINELLLGKCSP